MPVWLHGTHADWFGAAAQSAVIFKNAHCRRENNAKKAIMPVSKKGKILDISARFHINNTPQSFRDKPTKSCKLSNGGTVLSANKFPIPARPLIKKMLFSHLKIECELGVVKVIPW